MIPALSLPVMRFITAAALLASAGSAPALTTPPPDPAVSTLRTLGPDDLDVTRGRGKAFLAWLFPEQSDPCSLPMGENRDFDSACMWSQDQDEEDFDLLIGIEDHAIVSVVTTWPQVLDGQIWACEPIDPDHFLYACSVRSADAPRRARWTASWHVILNAIN